MEESLKTLADCVICNVCDKVCLWLCDLNAADIGRRLGRGVFVLSARTCTFGLLSRCTHTPHISLVCSPCPNLQRNFVKSVTLCHMLLVYVVHVHFCREICWVCNLVQYVICVCSPCPNFAEKSVESATLRGMLLCVHLLDCNQTGSECGDILRW